MQDLVLSMILDIRRGSWKLSLENKEVGTTTMPQEAFSYAICRKFKVQHRCLTIALYNLDLIFQFQCPIVRRNLIGLTLNLSLIHENYCYNFKKSQVKIRFGQVTEDWEDTLFIFLLGSIPMGNLKAEKLSYCQISEPSMYLMSTSVLPFPAFICE